MGSDFSLLSFEFSGYSRSVKHRVFAYLKTPGQHYEKLQSLQTRLSFRFNSVFNHLKQILACCLLASQRLNSVFGWTPASWKCKANAFVCLWDMKD
jgi:hypothetical protein